MIADDVCEIINGLNLYAFAVDTLQWDLFDKVFTPDVKADYLGHGWTDLESWKHDFDVQHRALHTSQHTVTNHQVVVDGDRATATSYAHARLIREDPEGGDNFWECIDGTSGHAHMNIMPYTKDNYKLNVPSIGQ